MGWVPRPGDVVTDTGGVRHRLTAPVAPGGGQGAVWATEADGVAIKISTRTSREVNERIRRVARLDLHDLPVAAARRALAPPAVGYVMTRMTGMQPIGQLGPVGQLSMVRNEPDVRQWFMRTGGLRKRLAVIARLADVFGTLHSRGLIYGDLNGGNVLVSEAPERSQLCLIDLDNVVAVDEPALTFHYAAFTAPEFKQTGATQSSDRFSLAVMAWCLLTGANPYYGALLDALSPTDLREPWSTLAPFVDDPKDRRNVARGALDRDRVLSPRLSGLLGATLCTDQSRTRPPAISFAAAARSASCALADCECGWQNYVNAADCLKCGASVDACRFDILESRSDGSLRPWPAAPIIAVGVGQTLKLDRAMLGLEGDPAAVAMTIVGERGTYRILACCNEITVSAPILTPGREIDIARPDRVPLRIRCSA